MKTFITFALAIAPLAIADLALTAESFPPR